MGRFSRFGERRSPALLLWIMRRRFHHDRLPPGRVVVEFEFGGRRTTRLWLGRLPFEAATRSGKLRLEGPPMLVRAFPRRLQWSPMAGYVRTRFAEANQPAAR